MTWKDMKDWCEESGVHDDAVMMGVTESGETIYLDEVALRWEREEEDLEQVLYISLLDLAEAY